METIKYPSINQYKNVIKAVRDRTFYSGKDDAGNPIFIEKELPTITFNGTVKIHGTNSAWRYELATDKVVAQSRERDLDLISDNAGFCAYTLRVIDGIKPIIKNICPSADAIIVYGEWAGKGIHKAVAVSEVEKLFVIFGVRIIANGLETWLTDGDITSVFSNDIDFLNDQRVFLITQFQTYSIDIDFNTPETAQNTLVQLTNAVEAECPVGKFFGVSGCGEGIVWRHNSPEHGFLQFKVKGDKHANSKVKTLAPVDEEEWANVREFTKAYVTQARLEQGVHVMKAEKQLEPTIENMGQYLKWVVSDVMKEESQAIAQSNLDPKKVMKEIQQIARKWYQQQL